MSMKVEVRGPRVATYNARLRSVIRAVDLMHQRLTEPLSLREMARCAFMSPFHFNRVFRQITGIPPRQFLSSLRIEEAKRLLVETDMSVTSICFAVGYESLGTFTTRFTQHVGIPPKALRMTAKRGLSWPPDGDPADSPGSHPTGTVRGRITSLYVCPGPVLVGLFRTNAPFGKPVRCGRFDGLGDFCLEGVPDGRWHLFAASMPARIDRRVGVSHGGDVPLVARGASPVDVIDGRCRGWADLDLRPPGTTEPPVLLALAVPAPSPARMCSDL